MGLPRAVRPTDRHLAAVCAPTVSSRPISSASTASLLGFPSEALRRNDLRHFSEGGGVGKAERLRKLLASDRRTASQANKSLLSAEDALTALEEREQQRSVREQTVRGSR